MLAADGVRELVLVSENSTAYGKDLGDVRLLEQLLPALAAVSGILRVRVVYLQPAEVRPGLLEAILTTPGVAPYLDLSFQHASAEVLRRMRRFGDGDRFLELLAEGRALRARRSARAATSSSASPVRPGPTSQRSSASWKRPGSTRSASSATATKKAPRRRTCPARSRRADDQPPGLRARRSHRAAHRRPRAGTGRRRRRGARRGGRPRLASRRGARRPPGAGGRRFVHGDVGRGASGLRLWAIWCAPTSSRATASIW